MFRHCIVYSIVVKVTVSLMTRWRSFHAKIQTEKFTRKNMKRKCRSQILQLNRVIRSMPK